MLQVELAVEDGQHLDVTPSPLGKPARRDGRLDALEHVVELPSHALILHLLVQRHAEQVLLGPIAHVLPPDILGPQVEPRIPDPARRLAAAGVIAAEDLIPHILVGREDGSEQRQAMAVRRFADAGPRGKVAPQPTPIAQIPRPPQQLAETEELEPDGVASGGCVADSEQGDRERHGVGREVAEDERCGQTPEPIIGCARVSPRSEIVTASEAAKPIRRLQRARAAWTYAAWWQASTSAQQSARAGQVESS